MLYFICFIILFMFPVVLSIFMNFIFDEHKSYKFKNDLKYFLNILWQIIKLLAMIYFADIILFEEKVDNNVIKKIIFNISYFSIFFSLIICINYFSTRYFKFRICIKTFLDELVKFVQDNFILNLLFFALLIFIKNHDLIIGLIGSYFFFALTTIHAGYKQNINENNKSFKFMYKILQILLNLLILILFTSVEKIFSQYLTGQSIMIDFHDILNVVFLSLIIILNFFLPKLEVVFKQLTIYKKNQRL